MTNPWRRMTPCPCNQPGESRKLRASRRFVRASQARLYHGGLDDGAVPLVLLRSPSKTVGTTAACADRHGRSRHVLRPPLLVGSDLGNLCATRIPADAPSTSYNPRGRADRRAEKHWVRAVWSDRPRTPIPTAVFFRRPLRASTPRRPCRKHRLSTESFGADRTLHSLPYHAVNVVPRVRSVLGVLDEKNPT